jgi:hypothetical protein
VNWLRFDRPLTALRFRRCALAVTLTVQSTVSRSCHKLLKSDVAYRPSASVGLLIVDRNILGSAPLVGYELSDWTAGVLRYLNIA